MIIVVGYDVNTETAKGRRRLRRVALACKDYGQRVQKSVFECDLTDQDRRDVYSQLKSIMVRWDEPEDSVRFYKICATCLRMVEIIGAGKIELREQFILV